MIKPASYELSICISSLPSPVTVQTALVFQEQNQGSLNLLKRTKKLDKHGCQLGRRVVGVCPRVCLQFCLQSESVCIDVASGFYCFPFNSVPLFQVILCFQKLWKGNVNRHMREASRCCERKVYFSKVIMSSSIKKKSFRKHYTTDHFHISYLWGQLFLEKEVSENGTQPLSCRCQV